MTSRLREKSQLKLESFTKRYEVIGRIGEGAYGVVRLAYDKESNQKVAMKSLKPNLTQREGEGIPISVCREINVSFFRTFFHVIAYDTKKQELISLS